jgi:hypothetical protein
MLQVFLRRSLGLVTVFTSWFLRRNVKRWVGVSGSFFGLLLVVVRVSELVCVCFEHLCRVNNLFKVNTFICALVSIVL